MNFTEHKTKSFDKSSVWCHFLPEEKGEPYAKCKVCKKILKTNGGSTKGLLTHLNSVHKVKLQKMDNDEPRRKVRKITEYGHPAQEDSLPAVIARMTALDGFPFSKFITSTELRKSLRTRGFDVPKSQETIKSHFMGFYKKCKENMKLEIGDLKQQGEKFSITFDEWTSTSNKRFINIIVHANTKLLNIGLVRIKSSGTATNCIEYIDERLKEFGLTMSSDIVGFTTDGASTMKKIGKLITPKQQLCYAHGLHLALTDVFYKQTPVTDNQFSSDDDNDDDENVGLFEFVDCSNESRVEITEKYKIKPVVEKVRKIVKVFRKSPTKNDILQKYVKEEKNTELKLLLDCQTRWNTLYSMIHRFSELEIPIKKALIDLKLEPFTDDEFLLLKQIINLLKPMKLTLEALCRSDMTLQKADAALEVMLNEISTMKGDLSRDLYKSLRKRIQERRTVFSTILNFLKNPKNKSDLDSNLDMIQIKAEIKLLVTRLNKKK